MKKITLLVCFFLFGCGEVQIQNPQVEDVLGIWEGTSIPGIPYSLIEFDDNGDALIIVWIDELPTVVAHFKNFKTKVDSFHLDYIPIEQTFISSMQKVDGFLTKNQICMRFVQNVSNEE